MLTARPFDPNRSSLAQGVERIREAVEGTRLESGDRILTSRDPDVIAAVDALQIDNVPDGFRKSQLPVHLDRESLLYLTVGEPGAEAPYHSHDDGAGIRFIVSGSILHEGEELTAGDWMYMPAGQGYSFKVGERGVTMFYVYMCDCG